MTLREAMRRTAGGSELTAVDVPEWDTKIYLRRLNVRTIAAMDTGDPISSSLHILEACMADENGERLLTSEEDFELLLDQPWQIIMPLLAEAGKLNGLTENEVAEAVRSFGLTPSGGTSSGSSSPPVESVEISPPPS